MLKMRRGGLGLVAILGGLMVLSAGASAAQQPADPDDLQILAVCGESIGLAFYDNPPGHEGWSDDRLTDGRYAFARDKAGRLRVIYRTKGADWVDEEADGGKVVEVSSDVGRGEVAAVVYYPATGVMETYNVHRVADGHQWLSWTSNKNRTGGVITKVAAYRAECAGRR